MRVLVWTVRVIFLIVAVWGMYGFGGAPLADMATQSLHLPFKTAAFLVSVLVALLGAASALLSMWHPRDSGEQDEE